MSEEKEFKEKFSPERVAELIRSVDPEYHDPSDEQRLIISIESNPTRACSNHCWRRFWKDRDKWQREWCIS